MDRKQTVLEASLDIYAKIIKIATPYVENNPALTPDLKQQWESIKTIDVQKYVHMLCMVNESQMEAILLSKYQHLLPADVLEYIRELIRILMSLYKNS